MGKEKRDRKEKKNEVKLQEKQKKKEEKRLEDRKKEENVKCTCGSGCSDVPGLLNHVLQKHSRESTLCTQCLFLAETEYQKNEHIQNKPKHTKFASPKSKKSFGL